MRVVIDGLALQPDTNTSASAGAVEDPLSSMVARLLQVWSHPHDNDELHLIVGTTPQIAIPDWVTVHEVSSRRRGAFARQYARLFRVPRLCRSLRAHVLLGLRHTGKLAALACPRRTVVYDLFDQPEATSAVATASLLEPEGRLAWLRFARRLHLHLVDAVASADWAARRGPLHPAFLRPTPSPSPSAFVIAAAPAGPTLVTRLRQSVHPRRSVRWIVAASASTLAISAAAAASVDLAVSHSIPVSTPHQLTTPGASHSVTVGGSGGGAHPSGTVPLPAPDASSTTTSSTSTTTATSSTSATASPSANAPTSSSTPPVTVPSLPVLTLPTLTLPTITTPSLPPIPGITCTTSSTQTTSPLQSIINLCNLGTGGLPLGSK